ncbi:MAG TPA: hypothetical protein VFM55_20235 [Micromonosporaceae bacterium]|nr:hypothetical protein [Micromonosporaceae bacterium]
MAATDLTEHAAVDTDMEPDPLLAVTVDLVPGMRVWVDRHVGDVPMMGVVTGRAHLVVSLGVGRVQDLSSEHAAVVDRFAAAARVLADELRDLVAARE